jgi:peptide-methionine (S)-S-oxide reductase
MTKVRRAELCTRKITVSVMTNNYPKANNRMKTAVFGTGCFWCSEAIFKELKGVVSVMPGYTGGTVADPTYRQVCSGTTGHAEVSQVVYDPELIGYDELLEVFWKVHDPTSLNRQGGDVGTQYRSSIFYSDDEQRTTAESQKAALNASGAWERPIVTEIAPLGEFYPAENYHHDYFANNPDQGYCQMVVRPKLEKFRKVFARKLK